MASPPDVSKTDLVTFTILLDGNPINDVYQVTQIQVIKDVNKIPSAKIVLIDGSAEEETFEISESGDFVPGKEVEIKLGYHSTEKTIFKGLITRHGLQVKRDKSSFLVVHCNDKAAKMTIGRKNAYYLKKKDSDVIGTLIGNAGLQKDVEATTFQHPELIQYYATDWDFMLNRAEVNGMIVLVDDGKVSVKKPAVSESPALVITSGDEIQEINTEVDARLQLPKVTGTAWDQSTQKLVTGASQEPSVNAQGNITGKKLSEVLGATGFDLQTPAPIPTAMLKTWANAQLLKSRLARIRGEVTIQGHAGPKPGTTIELAGLGARFNGNAFISGVMHQVEQGEWTTHIAFGLSPNWFTEEQLDIETPLTSGLLPGMHGLQIGTVKKIHDDPDGETRIQVDVPMIKPSGDGVWTRIATFYATNNAGAFFMPEIGDEVILGFLNDDPRFPIILGSVYSKKHKPPYTPDDKNTMKAIVTNSQMKIWFDDVKKDLQIETPGGHKITLSDDQTSITILDSNSNKMVMDKSGISIYSPKDINIKADGKMTLEATGGMDMKTQGDMNLEGLNVNIKAQVALTAEGTASATFKSSGNVTIQGAMVMIN